MPAFVGGASGTSGASTVVNQTINYTPTPGNLVIVSIEITNATAVSCADQNGNPLSGTISSGSAGLTVYLFYGIAIAGATSYKVSWTTAKKCTIAIAEYTGVAGIGNSGINNTSATPVTIALTTLGNNSLVVAGMATGANDTYTATSGIVREQNTAGAGNASSLAFVENQSATPALVTLSASLSTNAAGVEAALELLSPTLFTPPTISAEFHWGGGDGW